MRGPASGPGIMAGMAGGTVRRWLGVPGLGRPAFNLPWRKSPRSLPKTGQRQAAELTALVAARPLSSQAWLSLAAFRLVARDDLASVLAALRVSWLTGPNEGSVRWRRGVFGLALWEFLPGTRATGPFATLPARCATASSPIGRRLAVMPVIGGKSAEARTQIRALLAKQGVPPADFARIGLPAE